MFTSLALDAYDYPNISYYDHVDDDLRFASWNGSSWDIEIVDSYNNVGRYNSLVLDTSGYPRISYKNDNISLHDLKYASWDGSVWEIETVDDEGLAGRGSSLVLNSQGYPRISYFGSNSTIRWLKYASWNGNSWDIEYIDSSPTLMVMLTSLELDVSEYPCIAYSYNRLLRYTHWNGTSWDITTIASLETNFSWPSLELDSSGNPHISFYDATDSSLKYASWIGSTWIIEVIDSNGDVGKWSSLALDSLDNPHISYYDVTNQALKYAYFGVTGIEDSNQLPTVGIETYPSPFSSNLYISFILPETHYMTLSIYDLSGRLVENIESGTMQSGEHSTAWNPDSDIPDGCYLVALDACGERKVRRAILLR